MNPLGPTASEAATLRFVLSVGSLGTRTLAALVLFTAGLLVWCFAPGLATYVGLALILLGHLPLWVQSQTTAPGGATPAHEEVWAPVEDDWLAQVEGLEKRGARWDTTPWDISNGIGCLALLALLGALAAAGMVMVPVFGPESALRVATGGALLFLPLWINGMRTTWNPSELRKKGEALAIARAAAEKAIGADFDVVPTLALREGRKARYPVDARLMLRPAQEDATGFLGVQIQVALNNVQGTDYPYLYAVVLGKGAFVLPSAPARRTTNDVDTVFEKGEGEGVRYLVVRQHADRSGGWHTGDRQIEGLVATALALARSAWRGDARRTP